VVTPPGKWPTTGAELLRAGLAGAGRRGAIQAVVVTGHLDQPKRQALQACGLEIASEWWVTPQPLLPLSQDGSDGGQDGVRGGRHTGSHV
jgi:hypothetical protein